jgi:hypothetical protein
LRDGFIGKRGVLAQIAVFSPQDGYFLFQRGEMRLNRIGRRGRRPVEDPQRSDSESCKKHVDDYGLPHGVPPREANGIQLII